MPSTGTPRPKTREFATGASLSYTDDGPPERMIPAGEYLRISSILAVQGRTTENTFCSRTRRAINCEYCAPKSRTTIDCDSTDECLKSEVPCKASHTPKSLTTKEVPGLYFVYLRDLCG